MEENKCIQDSFDRLPDELLISIVSRIPLIEAGRISVFGHRWKHSWMFNSFLVFDNLQLLRHLKERGTTLKIERIRFVNRVNTVLNLHSGATIDEFRILFDLDTGSANDIDKWIEFAFRKRVKKLELSLVETLTGARRGRYTFPNLCDPNECVRVLSHGVSSCEKLVTLSLTDIHVAEEVLVFFISNCPSLEELCVRGSYGLKNLRTSSCSALKLRRLEIVYCYGFKSIEICSPNLVSYAFYGDSIPMAFKNNVPSLNSLSLGSMDSAVLLRSLIRISGCVSRLETLTLHTSSFQKYRVLPKPPYLPSLKKMVIETYGSGSFLSYTPLINAAPMLREIVVKIMLYRSLSQRTVIHQDKGHKHDSLEVFRIEGFSGTTAELELAQYVIDHAVSLKKIVIDFRRPSSGQLSGGCPVLCYMKGTTPQISMVTEGVCFIKEKLPPGVELIVRGNDMRISCI